MQVDCGLMAKKEAQKCVSPPRQNYIGGIYLT
jgi:hypothetical protein